MKTIQVLKTFRHCAGADVHPTTFEASEEAIEVDDRTAEVALSEGWAEEVKAKSKSKPKAGPQSGGSGTDAKPSSSPADGPSETASSGSSGNGDSGGKDPKDDGSSS